MMTSNAGINLIKKFEGCRLAAYKDTVGVWTIGYGHTGGVTPGMKITQADADTFLRKDLTKFEGYVNSLTITLSQNEFDALVSFTYNCGYGNLKKLVKGRNKIEIANALLLYNKAGGKVLAGLTKRRKEEQALFLGSHNAEKDLQRFLNDHGANLVVDGIIGAKSVDALKNFLQSINVTL